MGEDLSYFPENDHVVADADALGEVFASEDEWEVDCVAGSIGGGGGGLQAKHRRFSGFDVWFLVK